jgi:AcrR family transcriptional regulator
MSIPYESTGRTRQKQRTRDALVAATQTLLAQDATPTVEEAADAAGISRTTAYRYFANQRALLLAAIPEIDRTSMLDAGAPDDVATRVDLVITAQTKILRDWEPQLRAALRLSLEPELSTPPSERSVLRQGRAIGWITEALEPLARTHPQIDRRRLAIAIRATCGIEAMVWLTDVARLSRRDASLLMRSSAQALLSAALAVSPPN